MHSSKTVRTILRIESKWARTQVMKGSKRACNGEAVFLTHFYSADCFGWPRNLSFNQTIVILCNATSFVIRQYETHYCDY